MKPSKKKSTRSSSSGGPRRSSSNKPPSTSGAPGAADIMDVPNMFSEDEQSLDSLEVTSRYLKGTLNASIRSGGMGSGGGSGADDEEFRGSVGSAGSSGGRNKKGMSKRASLTDMGAAGAGDHVDMPHLDDILRASSGDQDLKDAADAAAGSLGAEGAMGGGAGTGEGVIGAGMDQSSRSGKSGPLDWGSVRSGGSGGSKGSKGRGKKKGAIIIHDEEQEASPSRQHGQSQEPSSSNRRNSLDDKLTFFGESTKSLNLDMPTLSDTNKNKRSSWVFENLWGGNFMGWPQEDEEERGSADSPNNDIPSKYVDEEGLGQSFTSTNLGSHLDVGSTTDSESSVLALMRTISGRVGFMRSDSQGPSPPRYYGMRRGDGWSNGGEGGSWTSGGGGVQNFRAFVREKARWVALCVIISVGLAATIGAFVVMIPLWMESDERTESAELGGLAYEKEGTKDTSPLGGHAGIVVDYTGTGSASANGGAKDEGRPAESGQVLTTSATPAATNVVATNGGSSGGSESSSSASKIKPPPYNLQQLCSHSSITTPAGYQKCVSACMPSRCCQVPEKSPYEVWTVTSATLAPPISGSFGTKMKQSAESSEEIGTIIESCFHSQPDLCVHYYNQCSVLGNSVLLPRKPPTKEEVGQMGDGEKLELAEWINHSCGKLRNKRSVMEGGIGGAVEDECHLLCKEKRCCFAEDDVGNAGPGVSALNSVGNQAGYAEDALSASESSSSPVDDGTIDQNEYATGIFIADSEGYVADNDFIPDYLQEPIPTERPTSMASILTEMPTSAGSSYKPTPSGSDLASLDKRRRLGERNLGLPNYSAETVHLAIPGEEDFVYVVPNQEDMPFGTEYSGPATFYGGEDEESLAMGNTTSHEEDLDSSEPAKVVPKYKEESAPMTGSAGASTTNGSGPQYESCAWDPREFCTTYAGCAPLFGK